MSTESKTGTSFTTKVVVVVVAIIALLSYLTPNTDSLKRFDTPINQIFLLSFVSNPEGLYMASEIWESEKRYDFAIREMRMAIGLLEMHNADAAVLKRYRDRLAMLKSKQ
ncbi:hypothetical protein RQP54_11865 [Curvibacter sp. APW13]|uniref:hypothetical protein n=1 Tax=Curvibacter sp. APW13 TaxID=3077236 RepID=UPI0028DE0AED|nr:hypothetical protein [Curvibacter sp. APW13]MDT8991558.1 hypothetical protein [Curvibacter sp. APW13]